MSSTPEFKHNIYSLRLNNSSNYDSTIENKAGVFKIPASKFKKYFRRALKIGTYYAKKATGPSLNLPQSLILLSLVRFK